MSVPEEKILGSYRLLERIGKGGMGEVYRAQHLKLGREAAVKVLPSNLAAEVDFLKRFEREAASAASLDHPNILAVWEYGEQSHTPYLVMPYVRGGTLKDRLEQGALPREEMLRYVAQMAEALDFAHERGIVHRDVKPANMLLDGRGRLYLADFGIAKALEGAEGLTRTGVGVGTPEYMAPEQAQGRADGRSDLYALAVVLYQMLTGRVPYSGNSTVEVLMKHMQEPLPMLPLRGVTPQLSPDVERVLQKALAKNPNDRYQTGRGLVEAFSEAITTQPGATGAATVIGGAAMGNDRTVLGGGTPPPWSQGDATVLGGGPPHGGSTPPPHVGTPPGGSTPPPVWGQGNTATMAGGPPMGGQAHPPAGNTPAPWGAQGGQYANPGVAHAQPVGQPAKKGGAGPLIFGGIAAVVVLLLLCVGGTAFAVSQSNSNNKKATQTAQAQATAERQAIVAATGTAGAVAAANATATASVPTPTPVPPTPTTAPATATTAPAQPTTRPQQTATTRPQQPTAAPAGNQNPSGQAPAGWKTYRNEDLPFAMYYPPDWVVNEDDVDDGLIYFFNPQGNAYVIIATTGEREPGGNIDVLRDVWFKSRTTSCNQSAVDVTRNNQFSGITFAAVGATCDMATGLQYIYTGLGLRDQYPWIFELYSPYKDYDANLEKFFYPMINSLNIYGNP